MTTGFTPQEEARERAWQAYRNTGDDYRENPNKETAARMRKAYEVWVKAHQAVAVQPPKFSNEEGAT